MGTHIFHRGTYTTSQFMVSERWLSIASPHTWNNKMVFADTSYLRGARSNIRDITHPVIYIKSYPAISNWLLWDPPRNRQAFSRMATLHLDSMGLNITINWAHHIIWYYFITLMMVFITFRIFAGVRPNHFGGLLCAHWYPNSTA